MSVLDGGGAVAVPLGVALATTVLTGIWPDTTGAGAVGTLGEAVGGFGRIPVSGMGGTVGAVGAIATRSTPWFSFCRTGG